MNYFSFRGSSDDFHGPQGALASSLALLNWTGWTLSKRSASAWRPDTHLPVTHVFVRVSNSFRLAQDFSRSNNESPASCDSCSARADQDCGSPPAVSWRCRKGSACAQSVSGTTVSETRSLGRSVALTSYLPRQECMWPGWQQGGVRVALCVVVSLEVTPGLRVQGRGEGL